ncbi:hypothetical protein [Streptomyces sp. NPDC007988]|uniref:hypothetical protein n=1 Tax=Streptomyces sp. NPDC007988 TaxID=3364802 RepID=UPI0036EFFD5A
MTRVNRTSKLENSTSASDSTPMCKMSPAGTIRHSAPDLGIHGTAARTVFKERHQDEEELRRDERRLQEAEERRQRARYQACNLELSARADHTRLALVRHSGSLPGIQRAIVRVAREHRVPVGIGWSVGESRYTGGVPLVADDGALLGVFDPLPTHSSACDFLRDVGGRESDPQRSCPAGPWPS